MTILINDEWKIIPTTNLVWLYHNCKINGPGWTVMNNKYAKNRDKHAKNRATNCGNCAASIPEELKFYIDMVY